MTELPPLPQVIPNDGRAFYDDNHSMRYTADQMRSYALAAVEAEREACAKLCAELPRKDPNGPWFNDDMSAAAYECAAAIRNRG